MTVGRVYKIIAPGVEQVYVGSTCATLKQRLSKHRSDMKSWLAGKHNYYTSFQILAHEHATIELVEVCEFTDKSELHQREAHWIGELPAVNKWKPPTGLSRREYKQQWGRTHPRIITTQQRERKKERDSQKVTCLVCGKSVTRNYLKRHIRCMHPHE